MKGYLYLFLMYMLLSFTLNSVAQINSFLAESVHSISTGGALLTVSGDEILIFSNPAGLVDIENSKLTALYFGATFNIDSIKTIFELNSAYNEANDLAKLSAESINKLQNYNSTLLVIPVSFVYVHPGIALSFLRSGLSVKTKFDRNDKESIINISAVGDSMISGSFGFQIIDGLSAGGNVKYIYRLKMDENNVNDLINSKYTVFLGRYIGADVGILWEKDTLNFGLLIADILGTNLTWNKEISESKFSNIEKPFDTKIDRTLNFGVSYRPEWKLTKYPDVPKSMVFALGINGIHSISRNVNIGMEMELFHWLFLRMGVSDGLRIGVGFKVNMWLINLVYATRLRNKYFDYTTNNNIGFSVAFSY